MSTVLIEVKLNRETGKVMQVRSKFDDTEWFDENFDIINEEVIWTIYDGEIQHLHLVESDLK